MSARVDCLACGASLLLPEDSEAGRSYVCPGCNAVLADGPALRSFRWESLPEDVRRHGASRANLAWALFGCLLWIPLALAAAWRAEAFDGIGIGLLIGPYLVLLALLVRRRPRRPALGFALEVWALLGAYLLWTSFVLERREALGRALLEASGDLHSLAFLRWFALAVLLGASLAALLWRRHARSLPRLARA